MELNKIYIALCVILMQLASPVFATLDYKSIQTLLGTNVFASNTDESSDSSSSGQIPLINKKQMNLTDAFHYINHNFLRDDIAFKKGRDLHIPNIFGQNLLHVFSFNVGQGNFIIVKSENEIVVVDAGRQKGMKKKEFEQYIKPRIANVVAGTVVRGGFVTHPHDDHYSEIANLLTQIGITETPKTPIIAPENKNPRFPIFLGGPLKIWQKIRSIHYYFKHYQKN